ncbi:hypothetical protein HDU76_012400 [Blyttiomyces sp. JEL0837]|nr:hypothetical protein HDU76_012400 [Blyttiomyces sp. JEL0837]
MEAKKAEEERKKRTAPPARPPSSVPSRGPPSSSSAAAPAAANRRPMPPMATGSGSGSMMMGGGNRGPVAPMGGMPLPARPITAHGMMPQQPLSQQMMYGQQPPAPPVGMVGMGWGAQPPGMMPPMMPMMGSIPQQMMGPYGNRAPPPPAPHGYTGYAGR